MSDHYRRGDPETGCGLLALIAIVLLIAAIVFAALWLVSGATRLIP